MGGSISIDSLYLNVRYPRTDIFQRWYPFVEGMDYRRLKEGKVVGDFVVRNGASCYKFSLWQSDAKVFLTDQVDDKVGEGLGSGMWVQLGPKFLIHHANNLREAVKDLLAAVGMKEDYPIRITRIDVAVDLFGVAMNDQDTSVWQRGWVGRSKVSKLVFNSRTGALETINIGSRQSAVFLRIYDKIAQAVKDGDLEYWVDVWKGDKTPVTRVEWEVKPTEGNFSNDLKDFNLFIGFSVRELFNYLLDWGRLCIPDPGDSNNRRWQETSLWRDLRGLIATWADEVYWPTSRYGKEFHGVSQAYVRQVSGTLSGAMARFGEGKPDMIHLFEGLKKYGETLEVIKKKAVKKSEIYTRL